MSQSDERLLESALLGDGACFGELAERWRRRIFSFVRRYVDNAEEARDVTQNTFVKAFVNLGRLSDPSRFSSWLYRIALNECRMQFRGRRRLTCAPGSGGREIETLELAAPGNPEQTLADQESVGVLRQAMLALPDEQRTVVLMKEYQDLKFHEIAQILDLPVSTVKSRMYLGLKTLRRLMEKKL
jgi:RNA polymerase sigma-70 factor (ECF subfamily)